MNIGITTVIIIQPWTGTRKQFFCQYRAKLRQYRTRFLGALFT